MLGVQIRHKLPRTQKYAVNNRKVKKYVDTGHVQMRAAEFQLFKIVDFYRNISGCFEGEIQASIGFLVS